MTEIGGRGGASRGPAAAADGEVRERAARRQLGRGSARAAGGQGTRTAVDRGRLGRSRTPQIGATAPDTL